MSFDNMAAAQRAYDRQEPNFELASEEIPEMDAERIEEFLRWVVYEEKQALLESICSKLAKARFLKPKIAQFHDVFDDEIWQFLTRKKGD